MVLAVAAVGVESDLSWVSSSCRMVPSSLCEPGTKIPPERLCYHCSTSPRFRCKTLFLPHVIRHRDMPDEGGDRMRRDRDEPMHRLALVSAWSLALDPVLTPWDRR